MGKIIVDLDVALAEKKMTLTEFSNQVDISLSNLPILKTNKARTIRFSTLSEICQVLSCDVGDLLCYEEGGDDEANL